MVAKVATEQHRPQDGAHGTHLSLQLPKPCGAAPVHSDACRITLTKHVMLDLESSQLRRVQTLLEAMPDP